MDSSTPTRNLEPIPQPVPLEAAAPQPSLDRVAAFHELPQIEFDPAYYWMLVRRYQSRILSLILLATAAAGIFALSLPKIYESTAIVRVDPSGLRVVGDSSGQASAAGDARMLVATEASVITSPAVLQKTIDTLHLGEVPEFQTRLAANATQTERSDRLLTTVSKHVAVSQPLDTYLLELHFRSRDPNLAAQAANGLAHAFLEHEYTTRSKALTDSTSYMSDQVDALRVQMERDQTALVHYESANDVIDPDDRANIYQARLSEINNRLTAAQALRMDLQAQYDVAMSGSLDTLLASPRGQSLVPLHDRYLADQRELSHLATIYGPGHPLYQQQLQVVQADDQLLRQQQQHVVSQLAAQYNMAWANEQLLRSSLAVEKQSVDNFNLRAVRYHALKAAADSSTALYYDLQKQIQDATVAAGQRSENLRIISPATPAIKPVSPRVLLWIVVTFLLSTIVGIGAAVMSGVLDKTVSNPEQIERWYRLPVLGSLPKATSKSDLLGLSPRRMRNELSETAKSAEAGDSQGAPRSAFHEGILALHSGLSFMLDGEGGVVAITSSLPAEGKSTVGCNLAAAYAAMGHRTLIVDADMRKPSVHRKFGLRNRIGLSTLLRHRCGLAEAMTSVESNLNVITSGPQVHNPAELLHLHLEELIEQLRNQFDFVLLDCPPVLGFADTSNVAGLAGRVIVVTHAGTTERGSLSAALRQLTLAGANISGIVLNQVSTDLGRYYGYYNHSGYSYYANDREALDD